MGSVTQCEVNDVYDYSQSRQVWGSHTDSIVNDNSEQQQQAVDLSCNRFHNIHNYQQTIPSPASPVSPSVAALSLRSQQQLPKRDADERNSISASVRQMLLSNLKPCTDGSGKLAVTSLVGQLLLIYDRLDLDLQQPPSTQTSAPSSIANKNSTSIDASSQLKLNNDIITMQIQHQQPIIGNEVPLNLSTCYQQAVAAVAGSSKSRELAAVLKLPPLIPIQPYATPSFSPAHHMQASSTAHIVHAPHLVQAPSTTHIAQAPSPTYHLVHTPSTAHFVQAPNLTHHLMQAPSRPTAHLVQAPSLTHHLVQAPSLTYHPVQAPSRPNTHLVQAPSIVQAPNPTYHLIQAPSTAHLVRGISNTHVVQAPSLTYHLVQAPSTTHHPVQAPSTTHHLVQAQNTTHHLMQALSTTHHLVQAQNTTHHLVQAPSTTHSVQPNPPHSCVVPISPLSTVTSSPHNSSPVTSIDTNQYLPMGVPPLPLPVLNHHHNHVMPGQLPIGGEQESDCQCTTGNLSAPVSRAPCQPQPQPQSLPMTQPLPLPDTSRLTFKQPINVADCDHVHVKRPMNAFMVWAREERRAMFRSCPTLRNSTISKLLGVKWKALSKEEKIPYYQEQIRLRKQHLETNPNYRYRPKPKRLCEANGRRISLSHYKALVKTGNLVPHVSTVTYPVPMATEVNSPPVQFQQRSHLLLTIN